MREFIGPVNPEQVQTELGVLYVTPGGKSTVSVHAPHLTVKGMPLQASAFLVSDGQSFNFSLLQRLDLATGRFTTDENGLRGRLVDGRDADLVTLGKIAQVLVPAVRKTAETKQSLFLEAERRKLHNELAALEQEIAKKQAKIEEKERELANVTQALHQRH